MKKKQFKMPSAYAILFGIIIVVAALTWVIPGGVWVDGVYMEIDPNPQGIYDILAAPVQGFFEAVDIALFVLIIGGFLNIVIKTGAIDAGIGSLLEKNKGREQLLIPILMILFGIGGTTFGMAEETIPFYPLIIPVFLLAGYDVVTAVMVILLGTGVGVLGSTINPFSVGIASDAANISLGLGITHRFVLFVAVQLAAIIFTMRYAKKVKEDPSKSIVADLYEEHKEHFLSNREGETPKLTRKRKVVLGIFIATFLIMILGVIPWAYKFDIMVFDNMYNALAESLPILGLTPNTAVEYGINYDIIQTYSAALGDWGFGQMTVLFFTSAIIIGIVSGMKEGDIVDTFIDGAKDLLGVAIIIGVATGIRVIMIQSGIDATILYWGSQALESFGKVAFINLTYLFYLPMAFLIPSTSGLAGASIPIMAPLGEFVYNTVDGTGASLVITAYAAASGVINLVTPTSGVVMGGLVLAKVPYERWLKFLGKFLIVLSIIIMLVLSITTLLV